MKTFWSILHRYHIHLVKSFIQKHIQQASPNKNQKHIYALSFLVSGQK